MKPYVRIGSRFLPGRFYYTMRKPETYPRIIVMEPDKKYRILATLGHGLGEIKDLSTLDRRLFKPVSHGGLGVLLYNFMLMYKFKLKYNREAILSCNEKCINDKDLNEVLPRFERFMRGLNEC